MGVKRQNRITMQKKNLFFVFVSALMLVFAEKASAYDFQVDGIYYTITNKVDLTVAVSNGTTKYSGDIVIPVTVEANDQTYTITSIAAQAFLNCDQLKSITIGSEVKTIESQAFFGCKSLVTVTLGDGITEIGGQAFMDCDHLESISFNAGLRKIGYRAFQDCIALSKIEIPDMVTELTGDMYDFGQTFMGCINLTEAVLGAGITTMAKEIFRNCRNLKKVTIKNGTALISESCFLNCDNLQTLSFPNSVKTIGNNACSGCSSLKQVVVGNGVTAIGSSAFKNCTHLETIHLGTDVKTIGFDAFKSCKALEEIVIPDNVETFGQAMYGESETFVGCTSLKKVTLGKNVAAMGKSVFSGCTSLETLIIKDGVSYIGNTMFKSCNRMKNIKMKCTVIPKTDSEAFSTFDATLAVPSNMLEEYKAHAVWGRFGKIVTLPDEEPKDFVSLTVRQADNGVVKVDIPNGEHYTLTIVPDEAWTVHSVTFNDEDVTDLLVDHMYTTPTITTDCTLVVAFEQPLNSINTIETSRARITSERNGNIMLNNLFTGESVTIYDASGKIVCKKTADADHLCIHIGRHGAYIVKTDTKTIKIRL